MDVASTPAMALPLLFALCALAALDVLRRRIDGARSRAPVRVRARRKAPRSSLG